MVNNLHLEFHTDLFSAVNSGKNAYINYMGYLYDPLDPHTPRPGLAFYAAAGLCHGLNHGVNRMIYVNFLG